jgi:hypothetical protein
MYVSVQGLSMLGVAPRPRSVGSSPPLGRALSELRPLLAPQPALSQPLEEVRPTHQLTFTLHKDNSDCLSYRALSTELPTLESAKYEFASSNTT